LIPNLVIYIKVSKNYDEGFQKIEKINSLGFKVLILKHFIAIDFQRWFLNKAYHSNKMLGKRSHQGHQTHESSSHLTHFPWETIMAFLTGKALDIDGVPTKLFQEYMDTTSLDL
jgi:hypothetical protein